MTLAERAALIVRTPVLYVATQQLEMAVADERAACAKYLETLGGRDDLAAIIRVGGHR